MEEVHPARLCLSLSSALVRCAFSGSFGLGSWWPEPSTPPERLHTVIYAHVDHFLCSGPGLQLPCNVIVNRATHLHVNHTSRTTPSFEMELEENRVCWKRSYCSRGTLCSRLLYLNMIHLCRQGFAATGKGEYAPEKLTYYPSSNTHTRSLTLG